MGILDRGLTFLLGFDITRRIIRNHHLGSFEKAITSTQDTRKITYYDSQGCCLKAYLYGRVWANEYQGKRMVFSK